MNKGKEEMQELLRKKAELERLLEQKQIQIDFLEKMIEIAGEEMGVDIRKTLGPKVKKSTNTE